MMQKSTMHDQQSEHNYSESRSPSPFGNESSSFKDMFEVNVNILLFVFKTKFSLLLILG